MEAVTKKGTRVYLAFVDDCEDNEGGYFVEIYLHEDGDRFDYFCIHPEDCDCSDVDAVERYAIEYVSSIEDY